MAMMNANVFDKEHWALTTGILLGVMLTAFEALAVVAIAPRMAAALDGMALYGWVFSGFLLASLLGTVVGGWQADVRGPGKPFIVGLIIFATGLLISGFAPNMFLLIVGRVVQGLGGGLLTTCLYAAVTVAYPDALRPRLIAFMSSAWVLPALLGPSVAGLLAELFSWRFVFWGMVPLLALTLLLAAPAFARLEHEKKALKGSSLILNALALVLGAGFFLSSLSSSRLVLAIPLGVLGAGLSWYSLRHLTPAGTLSLKPGLASVIAARGAFYAGFVGIEAFIALALTEVHGLSALVTGLVIAAGSLGWTAASWTQERLDARLAEAEKVAGRRGRMVTGTVLLAVGVGVQVLALFTPLWPLLVTVLGWGLSGFGVGLAHSTSSVLAFALAPKGEEGKVAAALQIADNFTAALSAGLAAALFAFASTQTLGTAPSIAVAFGSSAFFALLAVFAAYRIAPTSPALNPQPL